MDRIIINEAHLILTAADYCEYMGLLAILRQIVCPLVYSTATLPPYSEFDLKQSLCLTHPITYRTSSDRPNLEYRVQSTIPARGDESREEILTAAAERFYLEDRHT